MKSKKSAACRKSQSGLFLQAETGGACPRPSAFFGVVGADGRGTQPTGHRRRYGVSRRCKGPSDRRTPGGTSNRGAAAPLCLVVLRGGLSRRGKSKSPSLTDSFAPFWSFRKGPAGGRSPSEMAAERSSSESKRFLSASLSALPGAFLSACAERNQRHTREGGFRFPPSLDSPP